LAECEAELEKVSLRLEELEEDLSDSMNEILKNKVIELESKLASSEASESNLMKRIEALEKAASANEVIANAKSAIEKRQASRDHHHHHHHFHQEEAADGQEEGRGGEGVASDGEKHIKMKEDQSPPDRESGNHKKEVELSDQELNQISSGGDNKTTMMKKVLAKLDTLKHRCEDLEGQVEILSRQLETSEEQRQRAVAALAVTRIANNQVASKNSMTSASSESRSSNSHKSSSSSSLDGMKDTLKTNNNNNNKANNEEAEEGEDVVLLDNKSNSSNEMLASLSDDQLFFHAKLHSELRNLQLEKVCSFKKKRKEKRFVHSP
jgi:hypothetical protein